MEKEKYYGETVVRQIFGDYGVEQLEKYLAEKKEEKRRVGGRIFFIDEESDEKVVFYDKDGNIIENVSVGDTPYSYKITNTGAKPKYWVFHNKLSKPLRWMPYDREYQNLETSDLFGKGKENTIKVLHDTEYHKDDETIWNYICKMRDEAWEGCNDWFIPSKEELKALRNFFAQYADDLMLVDPFIASWLWTSSEYSASNAWKWGYHYQSFDSYTKNFSYSVFGVRAF